MRSGARRWLIRAAWCALLASTSAWLGLRVGRPLYYTDGARTVSALALAPAGMWLWSSPQPELALPGKVQGRVARLPDGRLIYARATERGDADLVLFDPGHPAADPEPAAALNSSAHDLAPGIAADGTLWFASDRDGGLGGFDLYTSRLEGGAFTAPVPVAACNTMRDETDPAPDPRGGVVFAQVDRSRRNGNDGVLLRWDGGELQPQPLFGAAGKARPIDRDPVFAADGSALWFVRQDGAATHVVRSARLLDAFDPPIAIDQGWGTGALRSPLPVGRGELWLLRPARGEFDDQWLRSDGREVLPWWTGQARIESLLLLCMLAAAVLLVLLHLGKRWRSLDLVTLCLLLSLLVHLLLMLWLMGVEIVGSMSTGDDGGGAAVQVTLSDGRSGGGGGDGSQLEDLAAAATFQPEQRALAAAAPAAAAAAATRQIEVADGAWSGLATAAPAQESAQEVESAMHDERHDAPSHSGTDPSAAVKGAAMAAVAPAARGAEAAAHSAAAAEQFTVAVPQAQLAGGTAAGAIAAPAASPLARPAATPARESHEVAAAAELHDAAPAGSGSNAHAGTDVVAAQAHAVAPLAQPAQRSTEPGGGAVAGGHSAASGAITADLPGDELGANRAGVAAPAAAAAGAPLPQAHAVQGTVAALHAPEHQADATPRGDARGDAGAKSREGAGAPLAAAALPAVSGDGARAAAANAPQHAADHAGAGTAPAAVAAPGSELRGGAAAVPLSGGSSPLPLPAPRARGTQSAGMPLADARASAPATAAAPGAAANAGPAAGGGVKAAPLPALAGGATGVAAPTHAGTAAGAGSAPAVAAPGSELGAAAHGITAASPASTGAPLPVPAARTGHGPVAALHEPPRADAGPGTAAPASAPASARAGNSTGSSTGLVAAALPALGAATDAVRPQHAVTGGLAPGGPAAAAPPGSLLARASGGAALGSAPAALQTLGTPYSNRFGPAKQKALEQFGGTVDTERAVRNGLRYLASIQRPDGGWGDAEQFDEKYGFVRVGKTALCLLAFLGAGHTPSSQSEHSGVARRAVDFLLQLQQRETGAFGVSSAYGHGIATYALAECYGITKDPALKRPVEDALSWILQHQGPRRDRRNQGGWGYFSPGLQAEDDYARVSISAWMVMALESARLSGIELPDDVLPGARRFLDLAWDQQNRFFRYNHMRSRLDSGWPTLPASTPAATFCLILLGERADSERLQQALGYTVERRPKEYRRYADDEFVQMGQGNVYFWYYGTLACFLAGGDSWKQWNERLSSVLPAAQERDGSFAPIDPYSRTAGDTATDRAFTTSMCVLSLEVYYRYFTPLLVGR